MTGMSEIDRFVADVVGREYAVIEQALERALTGGQHGVKVVRRGGRLVSAEPDPEVPYGTIHEHQLPDSAG